MTIIVREMRLDEVGAVIDYFHGAAPEHLELLGLHRGLVRDNVDPEGRFRLRVGLGCAG